MGIGDGRVEAARVAPAEKGPAGNEVWASGAGRGSTAGATASPHPATATTDGSWALDDARLSAPRPGRAHAEPPWLTSSSS